MNSQNPLSSPVLWLAAGMGLLVGLMCLLLNFDEGFGQWLGEGYAENGFPELNVLSSTAPASVIALVIFTLGSVFAIDGTPGGRRRVMLLLSGLVILAMASPVLALWGVFWNPLALLVTVFWSGLLVMIHAGNRDKAEAFEIAEEQNVVRMNPPVSPSEQRKQK